MAVILIPVKKFLLENTEAQRFLGEGDWGRFYREAELSLLLNRAIGNLTTTLIQAGVDPTPYLANRGNTEVPAAYLYKDESVSSIKIPEGIKSIEEMAFYACSIGQVTLPSTLQEIGWRAFEGCENLTHINLPKSITNIEARAFAATALEQCSWPGQCREVSPRCFYDCSNLKVLEFEHGVTKIASSALVGCERLTALKLPQTLKGFIGKDLQDERFGRLQTVEFGGTKAEWQNIENSAENFGGRIIKCSDGDIIGDK